MQQIYKSEAIAWVSGGKKQVPLDFLQLIGPRGGRNVVEKFIIQSNLVISSGSTASMTAADQASFITRLRITDLAGNRLYYTGCKVREQAFLDGGILVPSDPGAYTGTSTSSSQTFFHTVWHARPKARRGWDFALPCEDLVFGGIFEIQMPASLGSDLVGTNANLITINSGTYTVFAYCREEFDMEFKCRDVREEFPTSTNTAWYLPISNRLLRGATAYKDATGGGTSVATVTDLTIDQLNYNIIPSALFLNQYLSLWPRNANDPAAQATPVALPFIFPKDDEKVTEQVIHSGQMLVRANSTMTTPDIMLETISPRDPRMMSAAASRNKIPSGARLVVKTSEGEKARDLASWGDLGKFLACKVAR